MPERISPPNSPPHVPVTTMSRIHSHTASPTLGHALPMWRSKFVVFLFFVGFSILALKAFWIAGPANAFYREQSNQRIERIQPVASVRGEITDRSGRILATSLPVRTIWADPKDLPDDMGGPRLPVLAKLLDMDETTLRAKFDQNSEKQFIYLKRQLPVDVAERIAKLGIPGIHILNEYKRYYPQGDITAQLVGFTDINDRGQDGVELGEQDALHDIDGKRTVIADRLGKVVAVVKTAPAHNGRTLALSIDSKIQYIAFSALRKAVVDSQAKGGAAIVVDARNGEILALANYPTYDPNDRAVLTGEQLRNRVMTDVFEPGSIMKPLTMSLALDLHRVTPNTTVMTTGRYVLDGATINDDENFGLLTMGGVIQKSSNIGATKIAMLLRPEEMWNMYRAIGLGSPPALQFPGLAGGTLRPWQHWRRIEQATMSYGYGLSTSLIQLAQAYTVFTNSGVMLPVSLYETGSAPPPGPRIFNAITVAEVRKMMESVVVRGGTAPEAEVPGYSVGGKTGTAYTATAHGYDHSKYRASFVGIVPIRSPRLIIAVSVNQPQGRHHFGGDVSGPVFAQIAAAAMHELNVPPDIPLTPAQQKAAERVKKGESTPVLAP